MSYLSKSQTVMSVLILVVFSVLYFETNNIIAATVIVASVVAIPTTGVVFGGFSEVIRATIVGAAIATSLAAAVAVSGQVAVGQVEGTVTGFCVGLAILATIFLIKNLPAERRIIIVWVLFHAIVTAGCMYGIYKLV